jgi:glycerol-3-phosphate dehydrogenase subunit C
MVQRLPDDCTSCSACVASCPVSAVTTRFRGPKLVGPALERFRLAHEDVERSLELCSSCRNCDIACPSGVAVSVLNVYARAAHYRHHRHKLRDWILAHGEVLARLAVPLAPLANPVMASAPARLALRALGIGGPPLPRYARRTFTAQLRHLRQVPSAEKVVFFPGCYVENNEPQVGLDLVAVLQAAGVEVVVPEGLVCCGAPLVANAYLGDAEENARRNVAALSAPAVRDLPIVTCCTSCSLMLGREGEELFSVQGGAAVARRVRDAAEVLLDLGAAGRLPVLPRAGAAPVLYHAPCHLRARGAGQPSLELLRTVPGLEVIEADAGCCGIAGSYGFKADRHALSMQIGARLFARVAETGVGTVATDCGTCRLQIAHGTAARAVHPLAVLRHHLDPRAEPASRPARITVGEDAGTAGARARRGGLPEEGVRRQLGASGQ